MAQRGLRTPALQDSEVVGVANELYNRQIQNAILADVLLMFVFGVNISETSGADDQTTGWTMEHFTSALL